MRKAVYLAISVLLSCRLAGAESLKSELFGDLNSNKEFQVTKVITADTLELDDRKVIQLIGIKAPNAPKPITPKKEFIFRGDFGTYVDEPVSPLNTVEEKAIEFAKSLLEGKTVRLESDIENRSRGSYVQVYVFLKDGTFVNAEILRNGYAELNIVPPNTKYTDQLREAYLEAKKELRGLYGQ